MRFVAKTKREKYLLKKLWNTLDELDECLFQYVPCATLREENASDFIEKLRKIFPEIHKKYSRKLYRRIKKSMK